MNKYKEIKIETSDVDLMNVLCNYSIKLINSGLIENNDNNRKKIIDLSQKVVVDYISKKLEGKSNNECNNKEK